MQGDMGLAGAVARTGVLFAVMTLLFIGVGYAFGYFFSDPWVGMVGFLMFAAVLNGVVLLVSDRVVLWSYRARILGEGEMPRLRRIVERVAERGGIPCPKVALVPTRTPNAFATGRSPRHAVVAVTEGLLDTLNDKELEGVVAHEISHVRNRDTLVMVVAATLAGAIAFAARWMFWGTLFGGGRRDTPWPLVLLAVITLPLAALLIQLAISRGREYLADGTGARLTGRPRDLASALRKISSGCRRRPLEAGNPASASLFIVNPFSGSALIRVFSTHPPVEERIERLMRMESEG